MLNWISSFTLSSEANTAELYKLYNDWAALEFEQNVEHYHTCAILSNIQLPVLYTPDEYYQYVCYCFGDFTPLISNHILTAQELITLSQTLLQIYDQHKGFDRKYRKGDPTDITFLRNFAQGEGWENIEKISFSKYHYPYHNLHAHTLANYSLSSLILRIVEHNLAFQYNQFLAIDIQKCLEAYHNSTFAPVIKNGNSVIFASSWSSGMEYRYCPNCKNKCDSLCGKFQVCLNCYIYNICRTCGAKVSHYTNDHKPYCSLHQIS